MVEEVVAGFECDRSGVGSFRAIRVKVISCFLTGYLKSHQLSHILR